MQQFYCNVAQENLVHVAPYSSPNSKVPTESPVANTKLNISKKFLKFTHNNLGVPRVCRQ